MANPPGIVKLGHPDSEILYRSFINIPHLYCRKEGAGAFFEISPYDLIPCFAYHLQKGDICLNDSPVCIKDQDHIRRIIENAGKWDLC